MPSIARTVKSLIQSRPYVYESLSNGIISYQNLAENLKPEIETELGREVKLPAVVMAIRRYAEDLQEKSLIAKSGFHFDSEIVMKTGLADITLVKSPSVFKKLKEVYALIDFERGDTLNVIQGNYEITFVISEKYTTELLEVMKEEEIINVEKELVSLSLSFSKDFLYTPGIIATISRKLAWENINVYENISTMTELTFILLKRDAVRAYKALQGLVEGR